MSQQNNSPTNKNPASIKIAAKEASQRTSAGGAADPGPGDSAAEPSELPQAVDIPEAPTPSQLVVKSSTVSNKSPLGSSRSYNQVSGASKLSTTPSQATGGLSKMNVNHPGPSGADGGSNASSASARIVAQPSSSQLAMKSATGASPSAAAGATASSAKSGTGVAPSGSRASKNSKSYAASAGPSAVKSAAGSSNAAEPADTGPSQESPKTQPASSPGAPSGSPTGSEAEGEGPKSSSPSPAGSEQGGKHGKKKKKKAHFRYHKRITVRTKGNKDPGAIMDKVNYKDHRAGITPSAIEDMDPQELMKRAGIKGTNKTHWRVRLRQTERITKDGKTTTQTKVAYRDSKGNKRVKTSMTPNCQKCGKKLEDCECDDNQQSEK